MTVHSKLRMLLAICACIVLGFGAQVWGYFDVRNAFLGPVGFWLLAVAVPLSVFAVLAKRPAKPVELFPERTQLVASVQLPSLAAIAAMNPLVFSLGKVFTVMREEDQVRATTLVDNIDQTLQMLTAPTLDYTDMVKAYESLKAMRDELDALIQPFVR